MAFFDDLGKKISKTTQNAVQKTKDFSDVAKLNSQISDEEKKINSLYSEIGKIYISLHKDDPETSNLADLVNSVKEAEANITAFKHKIQDIKGVIRCAKCSSEISNNAAFCSVCGAPVPKPTPEQPSGKVCPACGNTVAADILFCTQCGNKFEESDEPNPNTCPTCGTEAKPGMSFCTNCGTKV